MAKDASFDVVSEIDMQEVDNALNQARSEASTRYDLRQAGCEIDLETEDLNVTMTAADSMSLKSLIDVVSGKLIRRGIDAKAFTVGEEEPAAGGTVRKIGKLVQGIPTETGKEINKLLKQAKMKVTVQIQGDQVRVSGKKKDDLQAAIALIKEQDNDIPLQFRNFR